MQGHLKQQRNVNNKENNELQPVANIETNQKGSQSHLVNTKVYKAKFSLVDVSVNAKKYY